MALDHYNMIRQWYVQFNLPDRHRIFHIWKKRQAKVPKQIGKVILSYQSLKILTYILLEKYCLLSKMQSVHETMRACINTNVHQV
jgi:hypothetical protein